MSNSTVICIAKEKMITRYFVTKLARKMFWFFMPGLLILGIIIIVTASKFNVINLSIALLSIIGLSYILSEIISAVIILNKITLVDGRDVFVIYFKIKNDLEKMKEEEANLEMECPKNTLFFPAYIDRLSRTDPRKRLAKIKTKILLAKTELNLFDY